MNTIQLVSVFVGILMILAAMSLFSDSGGTNRLLRNRVLATREVKASQSGIDDAMIGLQGPKGPLLKLASLLGYQPSLPPKYAASPQIVGPMSAIAGVVVFNLSGRLLPQIPALLLGIIFSLLFARFLFGRKVKAYREILFKQIPDSMSLMLRAVRAGLPVVEAIRNVGRESMSPTQDEFARVAGETALGMPVEVAIRRLAERTNIQEYAFFSVIIGLHGQTGGNLSETLENMSDMVRRRLAMVAKGRALSAEGRLSAIVMGALPVAVGFLTFFFNPEYLNEFVVNPRGPTLIGAFVVLLATGFFVSHLIIQTSMED
jgi:tight adherence protein B